MPTKKKPTSSITAVPAIAAGQPDAVAASAAPVPAKPTVKASKSTAKSDADEGKATAKSDADASKATAKPAAPASKTVAKLSAQQRAEAVRPLDAAAAARVLAGLEAHYGGMGTALDYGNDFELLIAVMLSAQTTDVYVNKVTPGLFARYPTPQAMTAADLDEVERLIGGVSFYKTKAKNLIATSRILVEQYGGRVPADHTALVALPGVGNKTANVVVSTAFDIPAIAVDTHVFRVSNRLGLATAKTVEETERQLQQAIPRELWSSAHHWLIWHGRKICKAPVPRCEQCFLTADCRYYRTQVAPVLAGVKKASAPKKAKSSKPTS